MSHVDGASDHPHQRRRLCRARLLAGFGDRFEFGTQHVARFVGSWWLAAVLLAVSGCSDGTGTGPGTLNTRWLKPQLGSARARPAVADGIVYFGAGSGPGRVVARRTSSGDVVWTSSTGPERVAGVNLLVSEGVLVVPTVHYTVGFDALSGRELWRYRAPLDTVDARSPSPGEVRGTVIDADDQHVYIPAWGASVSAVDLRTGIARWVWEPGPSPSDTGSSGIFRSGAEGVTVSGDTVFAGVWHSLNRAGTVSEQWLVALDARTGAELWRIVIPAFASGVSVYGAPKVYGRLVIFSPLVGYTWAFDRTTRDTVWRYVPKPYHAAPVGPELYGDYLYVDVGDDSVVALGAADGVVRWKAGIGGSTYHGLLVTERRIYVPWGQWLTVLDRASGRKLAEVNQPGRTYDSYIASAPAASGRQVFINVSDAAWSFDEP